MAWYDMAQHDITVYTTPTAMRGQLPTDADTDIATEIDHDMYIHLLAVLA